MINYINNDGFRFNILDISEEIKFSLTNDSNINDFLLSYTSTNLLSKSNITIFSVTDIIAGNNNNYIKNSNTLQTADFHIDGNAICATMTASYGLVGTSTPILPNYKYQIISDTTFINGLYIKSGTISAGNALFITDSVDTNLLKIQNNGRMIFGNGVDDTIYRFQFYGNTTFVGDLFISSSNSVIISPTSIGAINTNTKRVLSVDTTNNTLVEYDINNGVYDINEYKQFTTTTFTLDSSAFYGTNTTPLTGNLTYDNTDARLGTQITIFHNDAISPTISGSGATVENIGGVYITSVKNRIDIQLTPDNVLQVTYTQPS